MVLKLLHVFSKLLFGWEPQVSVSDLVSWVSWLSVCFGFFAKIFVLVLINDMGMNLLSGSRNESMPRCSLLIISLYVSHLLSLTFYIIKYVVYVCKSQHRGFHKIFQVKDRQRSRNTEITQTIRIIMVGIGSIKQLGKNIWLPLFALIRSGPKSVNPISVNILLTG
jgi:hypothetical protein